MAKVKTSKKKATTPQHTKYGGSWRSGICHHCGEKRSCLIGRHRDPWGEEERTATCFPCLKESERREESAMLEGYDMGQRIEPRFVSAEIRTFGATGETFARVAWVDEHGRRREAQGPRASADMRRLLAAAARDGVRPKHVIKPAYATAPMPAYARGRMRARRR